ncbi:methyltransferase domain-containing protein [Colletotrichum caudatum]|nr:methyltransferase domain-containing protein [Colletotrichum caudatum]
MSQDNPPAALDIDNEQDDAHSEVGSSVASSTTSVRNSSRDYRLENGRTYHSYKEGKYAFPNDARELDRLDLQHWIWLLLLDDRLGVAPPCKEGAQVGRVLDVGTGTGIWALNFADEHPEAEVYGVDLSPTLPEYVPPNLKFEIDDVEEDWVWSRPFDYIHSRVMTASISNWETYLRQCYKNLVPGGWVELQEFDIFSKSDDGTLKEDNTLLKWSALLKSASETLGRAYISPPELQNLLSEIGFVDVSVSMHKCPVNPWAKDKKYKQLGAMSCESTMAGAEAFTMATLTRAFDWTPEEVNILLIDIRNQVKNRDLHAYNSWYFIIGRKPEKEPTPAPPAPPSPEAATPAPAASPPSEPAADQPQSPAKAPEASLSSPAAEQAPTETPAEGPAKSPPPTSS